jgi:sortase (surface protein transpeptidase)
VHDPHDRQEGPATAADRARSVARGAGELLVTAGLVLLLFVVYELYVTDLLTGRRQAVLAEQLDRQWAQAPVAPGEVVPGDAFAVLHVPRLGADYRQVVLEGTAEEQLAQGPGHYAGTAGPGEQGNLALAGHRVGKGSPFLELDRLRPGDPVVVETAEHWSVYRVLGTPGGDDFAGDPSGIPGQRVVDPSDVSVISPTPGAAAGAPATGAYLTLTTCHPRFSARERLVVHARLDGAPVAKTDQPEGPPALRER